MADYLGHGAKIGVTTPSTNTVVRPEYDDMRPPGVTNHLGRLAEEAERWLGKPVISINVVTYWHGLRALEITDRFIGFTQLFSRF